MRGCCCTILLNLLLVHALVGQAPSVQLKVKESSGFLGLGGARYVTLRLYNALRQQPITSTNVHSGSFYYFDCSPVGDWQLDPDFVKDVLGKLTIEQNTVREPARWFGDIVTDGDSTRVLIGFQKSVRLQEPFIFRLAIGDVQNEVPYTVPVELWPGFETLDSLNRNAEQALADNRFRDAIAFYESIIRNSSLQVFPQHEEAKHKLLNAFQAYLNANSASFQALKDSTQLDPKVRIAKAARYRPLFMFMVDSLPALRFDLAPLDSGVTVLLDQARRAVLRIGSVTDSLQYALDEQTVRWILQGSVTGRTGQQYEQMVEALAYAFSSFDFADTTATTLSVSLPDALEAGLDKNGTLESYKTFIRLCGDRYQMHLALFPVDFLPNLRKDTAAFPLPYYSMLKAVSDFVGGNLSACNAEAFNVLRACYDTNLLHRYDKLRVVVDWRTHHVSANVLRLLGDAEELFTQGRATEAADKLRQAVLIAPEFAYPYYRLGILYEQSGDSALAIGSFQQATTIDTLFLSAYLERYNIEKAHSNILSTVDVMSTALKRGNDYWVTNFDLGEALLDAGEPRRAIKPFRRALELNPQSYETCIQTGKAYQAARDFTSAREFFNKAIEIDALRQEAVEALNQLNEVEHARR